MARKSKFLALAVGSVLLLSGLALSAADSHIRIVQITYVGGDVSVTRTADRAPARALVYQPLEHDSLVVTEDGVIEIEFENEITARLAEDSRLHLAELLQREDGSRYTRLALRAGTATFLSHLRDDDEFLVSTPYFTILAEAKARFRVDLTEEGGRVQVFKGRVSVETPAEVLRLSKGRQLEWNASTGETALAKLGPKDGWDEWNKERDDVVESARRRERWSSLAGGVSYYGDPHYGHHHQWGYCPYNTFYGHSYWYSSHHYYSSHYYSPFHAHFGLFGFGYYPHYWVFSGHYYPYYGVSFGGRSHHRRSHRRSPRRERHHSGAVTRASGNTAEADSVTGARPRRGQGTSRRATSDAGSRGRLGESWRDRAEAGSRRGDFGRNWPDGSNRGNGFTSSSGASGWSPVSTGSSPARRNRGSGSSSAGRSAPRRRPVASPGRDRDRARTRENIISDRGNPPDVSRSAPARRSRPTARPSASSGDSGPVARRSAGTARASAARNKPRSSRSSASRAHRGSGSSSARSSSRSSGRSSSARRSSGGHRSSSASRSSRGNRSSGGSRSSSRGRSSGKGSRK